MWTLASWSVTLATFMSWASMVSGATVTVYTDKAQWQNALRGQYLTEDFADSQLNDGVTFVSTESGHVNPAEECYQDVLASQSQNEPMTTWRFTSGIAAYGGDWTLGGPGGSGNSLLVYIADSSLYVGTIPNSYGGEFWGFISDTPFTSVKLIGGEGSHQQNYRLDNMVYSQVTEPGDIDGDGHVDVVDLLYLVDAFGSVTGDLNYSARCDFNSDGSVDVVDLLILAENWGK